MFSTRNRKLRYLRDKSNNAYWILRQGKFKQFMEKLSMEVSYQLEGVRRRIDSYTPVGVESRLGFDSQAVIGDSRAELVDLDSEYIDKRRMLPPSYRPTQSRRSASVVMQADPEVVKGELQKILSSFNVRERG